MKEKKFYCIWVRTGQEDNYVKEMQPLLDSDEVELTGKLHVLKKQMRLKNEKEYMELFFPGYVFLKLTKKKLLNLYLLPKEMAL